MSANDLSEADFAALAANYPNLYPACWRKAQRIRTQVMLEIDYQLMVSASFRYTDANAPVEVRRWKRAVIREDHPTLGGVRLHVPKRLQALLSLSPGIHLDCLRWGDEAWLLSFDSTHVAGLRHDLLAEWQALSDMQPLRELNAYEELIYDPIGEHRVNDGHINWVMLALAIMCGGMLLLSYLDAGILGLLPLLLGLSIVLWQLQLDIVPAKRNGWLLRVEHPLQRIRLPSETPTHWYRCGNLLIKQDYDELEPAAGRGALIYVDTSQGQLQIRLARVGQQLMAWRCRDSFLAWLDCTLDSGLIAIPASLLGLIALFHLISIGSDSSDPWVLAYSALGTGAILGCWRRWRAKARNTLIACFDEASK